MALSPDDIERRAFAVTPQGYDVDEVRTFLSDVAASLRLARLPSQPRSSAAPRADATRWPERSELQPSARDDVATPEPELPTAPVSPRPAAVPGPGAGGAPPWVVGAPAVVPPAAVAAPPAGSAGDAYAQLGDQVAELLRAAHDSAAAVRSHAEVSAQERVREAEQEARALVRKAESDATLVHDQAKRVLTTAQEQADTIVADAEYTAREILASAAGHAEEHTKATTERARRHADAVLRAERDALARLRAAQAGVSAAIDRIARSDDRPVLDLRRETSHLRFGISDGSDAALPDPPMGAPVEPRPTANGDGHAPERALVADVNPLDPSLALMRKAVGRAITAAATTDTASPAGGGGGDGSDGSHAAPSDRASAAEPAPAPVAALTVPDAGPAGGPDHPNPFG